MGRTSRKLRRPNGYETGRNASLASTFTFTPLGGASWWSPHDHYHGALDGRSRPVEERGHRGEPTWAARRRRLVSREHARMRLLVDHRIHAGYGAVRGRRSRPGISGLARVPVAQASPTPATGRGRYGCVRLDVTPTSDAFSERRSDESSSGEKRLRGDGGTEPFVLPPSPRFELP